MSAFSSLSAWWKSRQRQPLSELLEIEYDNVEIRVRVLKHLEPAWNQAFRWADITRVCFKDEGLWTSDSVLIVLSDREKPAVVPTEAKGGSEFFGALCDRGLFPREVWKKAIGDTNGGIHCWPPHEN